MQESPAILLSVIFLRKTNLKLFALGAAGYPLIEILWRRKTHWTMSLLGGVCCLSLGSFFNRFSYFSLFKKCVCGSLIITFAEFCCGCVVNIKMKRNVWNYANLRLNIKGQICLVYSFLWGLLCIPVNALTGLVIKHDKKELSPA